MTTATASTESHPTNLKAEREIVELLRAVKTRTQRRGIFGKLVLEIGIKDGFWIGPVFELNERLKPEAQTT